MQAMVNINLQAPKQHMLAFSIHMQAEQLA